MVLFTENINRLLVCSLLGGVAATTGCSGFVVEGNSETDGGGSAPTSDTATTGAETAGPTGTVGESETEGSTTATTEVSESDSINTDSNTETTLEETESDSDMDVTETDPIPTTTETTETTDPTDPTDPSETTLDMTTVDPTESTTDDPTDDPTDDTTTGDPECECADVEVPLDNGIFIVSDNAELWKYIPEFNSFESLGALGCGLPNTFSMAVDRAGYAWVMFNPPAGNIRRIDVTNPGDCTDPGYVPGQMGATLFGMAFVSEDQNNQCDRLYGNTYNGLGGFSEGPDQGNFLTIDPDNLQTSILGPTTFNGAELTGSGDGRAFMFGGVPAKLVEVDKQTGEYLETTPLGNLDLTNAFAFAFFAGDFYFFTESAGPGSNSKVTHFDYDDSDNNGIQDLTVVNAEGPIRIVGAGVSTCAPFIPM